MSIRSVNLNPVGFLGDTKFQYVAGPETLRSMAFCWSASSILSAAKYCSSLLMYTVLVSCELENAAVVLCIAIF